MQHKKALLAANLASKLLIKEQYFVLRINTVSLNVMSGYFNVSIFYTITHCCGMPSHSSGT